MSYGGNYGGDYPRARGPRQHQAAQMLPVPGREGPTRPMSRRSAAPPPPPSEPPRYDREPLPERPRRKRKFGVGKILLTLVVLFVVFVAGVWIYLDTSINRVDALADYDGRPAAASGTNWLIVGSDSRDGLTPEQEQQLATGDSAAAGGGSRTDTIMVAHLTDNSTKPTLLSLPRDSQVNIPGHGRGKINSAFSIGGPALLVKTVEQATGLRIDHYAEIGFGGFANIVDAIGGVDMCIDKEMHDDFTNITIPPGCQSLDGAHALGFVRMRHSAATPRSDLDRVENQRKFIGALVSQIATAGTILNPFHFFPLLSAAPDALTMDSGDHLHNLVGLAWAMRGISDGGVVTTTVPVTSGSAENWDKTKSKQLFDALRGDTQIPDSAIMN
ncbi:cell envelope-related function transcriptional attenuator common domain-containing protein [Amycolatopsis sacchari]|uniref:Cell envelope-related function transcriptional attenuator common domain-containing protein n=1 Tax=Amycolatopsis sacchari TaxID=115433 RepID=A0A1I3T656_9PSEU|nr:LCP family protein [Amycolatopsis sacchari]SFJ66090.1 cell envelope-related function transcriptional attenuator common domain-containing protein [Amycolatopsis sacchari]